MIQDPNLQNFANEWDNQIHIWELLRDNSIAHPNLSPITIKAMYVLGVIHSIWTSVTILINNGSTQATYLPAYGIFASGIDLLGRCIQGNHTTWTSPGRSLPSDIEAGYQWIADSFYRGKTPQTPTNIIQTNTQGYTIEHLVNLRHFTAHGQGTTRHEIPDLDFKILEQINPIAIEGIDSYWEILKSGDQDLINNLAIANVRVYRAKPLLVILELFEKNPSTSEYPSVLDQFSQFDWKVN